MDRRSLLLGASGLAAGFAAPAIVQAQGAYPSRPVRLVIPWPPGQATDLMARVTATKIAETWGQPIVPENRAGAGGMIGTDLVAKAEPDGYTVLAASTGPITTAPLVQRTPYDVQRDLAPVAQIGISPYVLVVRKDFPAQTAAEFVARVRAEPGKYNYATSGTGAAAHLITLMFLSRAKLDAVHVPFQGSGPGLTAVTAGQVDFAIETLVATSALFRQGAVRALGVSLKDGTELQPDLMPLARLPGVEGYDAGAFGGNSAIRPISPPSWPAIAKNSVRLFRPITSRWMADRAYPSRHWGGLRAALFCLRGAPCNSAAARNLRKQAPMRGTP